MKNNFLISSEERNFLSSWIPANFENRCAERLDVIYVTEVLERGVVGCYTYLANFWTR